MCFVWIDVGKERAKWGGEEGVEVSGWWGGELETSARFLLCVLRLS